MNKREPVDFMWYGMDLKIYQDKEDLSFYSVTNQGNTIFLEMLTDYYLEKLQDDFIKFMEGKSQEYKTEQKLSALDDDELTERKQGLGIS